MSDVKNFPRQLFVRPMDPDDPDQTLLVASGDPGDLIPNEDIDDGEVPAAIYELKEVGAVSAEKFVAVVTTPV